MKATPIVTAARNALPGLAPKTNAMMKITIGNRTVGPIASTAAFKPVKIVSIQFLPRSPPRPHITEHLYSAMHQCVLICNLLSQRMTFDRTRFGEIRIAKLQFFNKF
jgi:hypothetical protein